MGVYDRCKRAPNGFRDMVQLMESTPIARRQRMIDAGMQEDPEYTRMLMSYMFSFEDVMNLPDMELAELMSVAPPRIIALSIARATPSVREKFKKNTLLILILIHLYSRLHRKM